MPSPILSIVFLGKYFVLIRKQFFVQIQNIRFLADEAHAACILATFVNLHAKHLGHGMLNLQTVPGWCDVDQQDAEVVQTPPNLP